MATSNDLNIEDSGFVVFDGISDFTGRTLTAGDNVTISNGNGVAGNPVISLSNVMVVFKSPLINVKATGLTTIFTPTRPFVVTSLLFYADLIVNHSGGFNFTIGTNVPLYDDFEMFGGNTIPVSTGYYIPFPFSPSGVGFPVIQTGIPLVLNITLGDPSTTNNQFIYTIGYYLF